MPTKALAVSFKLEYTLGELKDRSAARKQKIMLEAAPQIQALQRKLSKSSRLGLETLEPSAAEEALKVYNAVVAEGRFVKLMKTGSIPRVVRGSVCRVA